MRASCCKWHARLSHSKRAVTCSRPSRLAIVRCPFRRVGLETCGSDDQTFFANSTLTLCSSKPDLSQSLSNACNAERFPYCRKSWNVVTLNSFSSIRRDWASRLICRETFVSGGVISFGTWVVSFGKSVERLDGAQRSEKELVLSKRCGFRLCFERPCHIYRFATDNDVAENLVAQLSWQPEQRQALWL